MAFHQSFLAADATTLGAGWIEIAGRRSIGVIAVSDTVQVLHVPDVHMPLRDPFQLIRRQMDSAVQVSRGRTFLYNLPTHYLVWAIVLDPNARYLKGDLPSRVQGYPMPEHWGGALRGAQKLGLVKDQGETVQLTGAGAAVKVLLPGGLAEWAEVHETIKARGGMTLAQCRPHAAAALRILLLQDALVQLVVEGLRSFPQRSANFAGLARVCGRLDHARAPVFFLKPEAAAARADDRGRIRWDLITSEDYRSSTFQQYKSILIHAGILNDTGVGGTTIKGYDPTHDQWELA